MAKSAEVKLAVFGRAGVGKSGKPCCGGSCVCVCARASMPSSLPPGTGREGGWYFSHSHVMSF